MCARDLRGHALASWSKEEAAKNEHAFAKATEKTLELATFD